ncbi:MAG: rhodanese-like domain-containing protein [Planctomycetaceae bacterium]|nr:rhodanese-like domain-containing protein [Planctomycetaceae bacterium]
MKSIRIAGLGVLLSDAIFGSAGGAAEHTQDSLTKVQESLAQETAVLVDVREQSEWDQGHLDGAKLLPLSRLQDGPSQDELKRALPEKKIVYLHCAAGRRCLAAGQILQELGYEVRCLKPGYRDLLAAGFKKAED